MRNLVKFLNTLHRLNGSNINTTAEAASHNEYAKKILVRDDQLIETILDKLSKGEKVLLTGFAGDGKTTISKIIADEIMNDDVDFSEYIIRFEKSGRKYVIIKDLSEIPQKEAVMLLKTELEAKDRSLLLVSNTGSVRAKLLALFDNDKKTGTNYYASRAEFESVILKGIECKDNSDSGAIKLNDELSLSVFNLVKRDNLASAKYVLKKILDLNDWDNADEDERHSVIALNVRLLKANNYLAVERMFYVYRKIYEYGIRLTMRNLVEHFAYTITGNRNSYDKDFLSYMFFDNFFGIVDSNALEIEAIKQLNRFVFAKNISSVWKRRIFNGIHPERYLISVPEEIYTVKRYKALSTKNCYINTYFSIKDQGSILRMIYFLNNDDSTEFNYYLSSFLCSRAFMFFNEIQKEELSRSTRQGIDKMLRGVLRDYCSGLRMPENTSDNSIYIAMARKSRVVNQSTQIVLGVFLWNRNDVEICVFEDSRKIKQFYLNLKREVENDGNRIVLDLPLLDYISEIAAGAPLEDIDSVFQKRLENIKLRLLNASTSVDDDSINVVYKDIHNDIHPITYYIEKNEIEVGNY